MLAQVSQWKRIFIVRAHKKKTIFIHVEELRAAIFQCFKCWMWICDRERLQQLYIFSRIEISSSLFFAKVEEKYMHSIRVTEVLDFTFRLQRRDGASIMLISRETII